jgi:hypothetical protein
MNTDASSDRTVAAESGPGDAGVTDASPEADALDASASGECGVSGIAGFKWTYESAFNAPGSCTPSELASLIEDCFGVDGSAVGCESIDMACSDCVFGAGTAAALLTRTPTSTVTTVNYGGCVQMVDPDGGAACARAIQTFYACEEYDCRTCTSISDPSYTLAFKCVEDVGDACDSYLNEAYDLCASIVADGGPAAACDFPSSSFAQGLTAVATVLCVN